MIENSIHTRPETKKKKKTTENIQTRPDIRKQ